MLGIRLYPEALLLLFLASLILAVHRILQLLVLVGKTSLPGVRVNDRWMELEASFLGLKPRQVVFQSSFLCGSLELDHVLSANAIVLLQIVIEEGLLHRFLVVFIRKQHRERPLDLLYLFEMQFFERPLLYVLNQLPAHRQTGHQVGELMMLLAQVSHSLATLIRRCLSALHMYTSISVLSASLIAK